MGEFRMPSLGADMEQGKVVEWLVKPGDYVHRGDVIAEVDTEKTVMEVESFEEGVISEFLVDLGVTVPVGTPLARITETPAATSPAPVAAPPAAPAQPEAHPPAPPVRHLAHELGVDLSTVHGTGPHGEVTRGDVEAAADHGVAVAPGPGIPPPPPLPSTPPEGAPRGGSSPRARRMAAELGLDLAEIRGTGPGGAVTEIDVRHAQESRTATVPEPVAAEPEPEPKPTPQPEPANRSRGDEASARVASLHHAVGVLMARSKREIPHYYLSTTIDLGVATEWMARANQGRPIASRLVPAALLLAATARAAKQVPDVNGFFLGDAFEPSEAVHLGVAVALRGGGLVAPAIHDADTLSVDELMAHLRDLVSRARAGRLKRAEMADPTITVTNLGDLGVETIFGVIYPPQVALVGFGRVVERPVARDGMIGVRPTVAATLSADHRASDGLAGGRLLARIDELLQRPEEL